MIRDFGSSKTESLFHENKSRQLSPELQEWALLKLLFVGAATPEADSNIPLLNWFEHFKSLLEARVQFE